MSALLLWFDHSVTGIVLFVVLVSAITTVTVALARETREPENAAAPEPATTGPHVPQHATPDDDAQVNAPSSRL